MKEKGFFRVSEVSRRIQEAVTGAFPKWVWVLGEIQGLDRNRHREHWYFDLSETTPKGETFRLSATIWKGTRAKLFGPGGRCAGVFDLSGPLDGTKIMALCQVDFYPPYGKLSLHIQDIDPDYTLGELEARRKALLARLEKENALRRNAGIPLPEVPLAVGLVTSSDSAAYNDFMRELSDSGFAFRVFLCDARMQGEDALVTIPAAIRALESIAEVDLIVLIRGGGSRLDLSWFDREEIVYSIVNCPLPVVTGIGHEIDVTVAQMVAHKGMKTPTAAGAFLAGRASSFLQGLLEKGEHLAREARSRVLGEERALAGSSDRIRLGCRAVDSAAGHEILDLLRRLASALDRRRSAEAELLARSRNRLAAGRHVSRAAALTVEIEKDLGRLLSQAARRMEREGLNIDLLEEKRRLLDPGGVVRRGFALVLSRKGGILKGVGGLARGDPVTVVMRDGRLHTEIKEILREVFHDQKKTRQLEIW